MENDISIKLDDKGIRHIVDYLRNHDIEIKLEYESVGDDCADTMKIVLTKIKILSDG